MATIDDLRAALSDRAADVALGPPPVEAAIQAGRRRTRSRIVVGTAVLVTGAAVAVAAIWGWNGADVALPDDPPPAGRVWLGPDGEVWTPELPGFDLPLGTDLTVPYTRNGVLVIDGQEIAVDDSITLPESSTPLLTVPDGVVVLSDRVESPLYQMYSRIELVKADGEVTVLDSGVIAGADAARQADGRVLLAYGWLPTPTADSTEVRVLDLGADDPPRSWPVDRRAVVEQVSRSSMLAHGSVRLQALEEGGWGQATLDVSTGEIAPEATPGYRNGIFTASGLRLAYTTANNDCLSGTAPDGTTVWENCDDEPLVDLSPDGRTFVTTDSAYDADTGERLATFTELLQQTPPPSEGGWDTRLLGWESNSSVVLGFSVGQEPGLDMVDTSEFAYHRIAVRCSTTTGECERIPHPVDRVGTYAR